MRPYYLVQGGGDWHAPAAGKPFNHNKPHGDTLCGKKIRVLEVMPIENFKGGICPQCFVTLVQNVRFQRA